MILQGLRLFRLLGKLSTIQKESGLVKGKSGLSYLDERFAQAMGCGVTDAGTFETFERFDVQIKNVIKIRFFRNVPCNLN